MQRNVSHMIRLEEIRVNPHAPEFAKPHPKQESIWHKQYPEGFAKVDLREYPAANAVIEAWKEGITIARKLAISVGMAPQNRVANDHDDKESSDDGGSDNDTDDGDNDWFYNPFRCPGNQLSADTTECRDNSDEDDICCGKNELSGR